MMEAPIQAGVAKELLLLAPSQGIQSLTMRGQAASLSHPPKLGDARTEFLQVWLRDWRLPSSI